MIDDWSPGKDLSFCDRYNTFNRVFYNKIVRSIEDGKNKKIHWNYILQHWANNRLLERWLYYDKTQTVLQMCWWGESIKSRQTFSPQSRIHCQKLTNSKYSSRKMLLDRVCNLHEVLNSLLKNFKTNLWACDTLDKSPKLTVKCNMQFLFCFCVCADTSIYVNKPFILTIW